MIKTYILLEKYIIRFLMNYAKKHTTFHLEIIKPFKFLPFVKVDLNSRKITTLIIISRGM